MISQGFEACKSIIISKIRIKMAYLVLKVPERAQNKAFQEKKYLTEGLEWIY